jgi:hypothetical protein
MWALIQRLDEARGKVAVSDADKAVLAKIWTAWDQFQGTENVRETDSFESVAFSLAQGLDIDAEYQSKAQKAGEAAEKALKTLDKQSRKWRSAYNLWREGRVSIDKARLAKDMKDSMKKMSAIFTKLDRVKRQADVKDYADEFRKLQSVYAATRNAFANAVRALEQNESAPWGEGVPLEERRYRPSGDEQRDIDFAAWQKSAGKAAAGALKKVKGVKTVRRPTVNVHGEVTIDFTIPHMGAKTPVGADGRAQDWEKYDQWHSEEIMEMAILKAVEPVVRKAAGSGASRPSGKWASGTSYDTMHAGPVGRDRSKWRLTIMPSEGR